MEEYINWIRFLKNVNKCKDSIICQSCGRTTDQCKHYYVRFGQRRISDFAERSSRRFARNLLQTLPRSFHLGYSQNAFFATTNFSQHVVQVGRSFSHCLSDIFCETDAVADHSLMEEPLMYRQFFQRPMSHNPCSR